MSVVLVVQFTCYDVDQQVLCWSERVYHWWIGLHWQTDNWETVSILPRHWSCLLTDEGKEGSVASTTTSADTFVIGLLNSSVLSGPRPVVFELDPIAWRVGCGEIQSW